MEYILADEIDLTMDNLNSFKHVILNEYYFASLALTYDPEDPITFETICCKCNTLRNFKRPITCCFQSCTVFYVILSSGPAVIGSNSVAVPCHLYFICLSVSLVYVHVMAKLIN